MSKRYQQGTIELSKTSAGPCWYIRFTLPLKPGEKVAKRPRQRIGLKADYPSKVKASVAAQYLRDEFNSTSEEMIIRKFADVIVRYVNEEMPKRFSTARRYQGMISKHIEPRWGSTPLSEMKAMHMRKWLDELELSSRTKAHIRDLMRVMFRFAMLWEWMEIAVNPMSLFKMEGATRRAAKPRSLTPAEFSSLLGAISHEPTRTMMVIAACLGLRCSEIGALHWRDIGWMEGLINVRSAIVQGHIGPVKTETSAAALPLHPSLATVLRRHRGLSEFIEPDDYVFASPRQAGQRPFAMNQLQTRFLRPTGERLGFGKHIGWHTFRHSYRSWMNDAGATPEQQRDLMRHTDIATTLNIYGSTFAEPLRLVNSSVVKGIISD